MPVLNERERKTDAEEYGPPEKERQAVEELVSRFQTVYDQAASILYQLMKIARRGAAKEDDSGDLTVE